MSGNRGSEPTLGAGSAELCDGTRLAVAPPVQRSRRLDVRADDFHPAYVVWELTLACDHACTHCGSRAGRAREDELSTDEALGVVAQLAAMRATEVVLIGGEAYLHAGFLAIVRALTAAGVRASMTTGGLGITAELARELADAGLYTASVSVDGLEPTHDRMRARKGSFAGTAAAHAHLRAAGIRISANTNLNRLNAPDLEALYEELRARGVRTWQVQLTAPLGRAADRPELLLQPWELATLVPRIAALKRRAFADGERSEPGGVGTSPAGRGGEPRGNGVAIMPGNNLGYFGPEEALLRSPRPGMTDHFGGCQAGRYVLGLEADGGAKGCPSLQPAYVGGNVRDKPLAALWRDAPELAFTRRRTVDDLWGFCRTCPFAATCMGGCSFTAHALFGRPGNNPFCHYRARTLAARGRRERLVPVEAAEGVPFDCARFELVEEPLDAPLPGPLPAEELVSIKLRPRRR
jgi:radical SAM protein with 4Fe4S-binding SPASM domain